MSDAPAQASARGWLDPIDRISEGLFGLIMVLTFTCAVRAASGDGDFRIMLIGAIDCNRAWGIIDAIMYFMACLSERAQGTTTLRAVRRASDASEGQRIIADALPPMVVSALQPEDLERVRQHLMAIPEPGKV